MADTPFGTEPRTSRWRRVAIYFGLAEPPEGQGSEVTAADDPALADLARRVAALEREVELLRAARR